MRHDEIFPAVERAFASGKPACVNLIIDQKTEGVTGGYEFMGQICQRLSRVASVTP